MSRTAYLYFVNVVGMGVLALLTMFTKLLRETGVKAFSDPDLLMLPIGFLLGTAFGLFSTLIVTPLLVSTKLNWSLPTVYVPSAIIVVWYTYASNSGFRPFDSSFPILCSVAVFGIISCFVCPKAILEEGFCRKCEYNLSRNVSGTCPECGAAVPCRPDRDDGM